MNSLKVGQIVVLHINTDTEVKIGISSVNCLEITKLQKEKHQQYNIVLYHKYKRNKKSLNYNTYKITHTYVYGTHSHTYFVHAKTSSHIKMPYFSNLSY